MRNFQKLEKLIKNFNIKVRHDKPALLAAPAIAAPLIAPAIAAPAYHAPLAAPIAAPVAIAAVSKI